MQESFGFSAIEITIPKDLPPIRGNDWLATAIIYLIYPDVYFVPYLNDYPPSIKASLHEGRTVLVQVYNGQKSGPYGGPGSRLALAEFIIRQHGSQLEITRTHRKGTDFRFTLPLWSDAAKN